MYFAIHRKHKKCTFEYFIDLFVIVWAHILVWSFVFMSVSAFFLSFIQIQSSLFRGLASHQQVCPCVPAPQLEPYANQESLWPSIEGLPALTLPSWTWTARAGRYRWAASCLPAATHRRMGGKWLPGASGAFQGCRRAGGRSGRRLLWACETGRPCSRFIVGWRGTWTRNNLGSCCGSGPSSACRAPWWFRRVDRRQTLRERGASRRGARRQRSQQTRHRWPGCSLSLQRWVRGLCSSASRCMKH